MRNEWWVMNISSYSYIFAWENFCYRIFVSATSLKSVVSTPMGLSVFTPPPLLLSPTTCFHNPRVWVKQMVRRLERKEKQTIHMHTFLQPLGYWQQKKEKDGKRFTVCLVYFWCSSSFNSKKRACIIPESFFQYFFIIYITIFG